MTYVYVCEGVTRARIKRYSTVRGPPFNIQGGGGGWSFCRGKISTGLGGALKISHSITRLYRTVFEVNLFISRRVRPKLFI